MYDRILPNIDFSGNIPARSPLSN